MCVGVLCAQMNAQTLLLHTSANYSATSNHAVHTWQQPPCGEYTLNCDATVCISRKCTGLSWALRDHNGDLMGLGTSIIPGLLSISLAKAMCVREALL